MKQILTTYTVKVDKTLVKITILLTDDVVPHYEATLLNISRATQIILRRVREEFVTNNLLPLDLDETKDLRDQFEREIRLLLKKYFPSVDDDTLDLLTAYLIRHNIGLGELEILLHDPSLEEIVVNNAKEPVWVYHRQYGWLKTNIYMESEERIRHYATIIGRNVGKEITLLNPLMDAHLQKGDRVNATLYPISTKGNTITIRKFSDKPWSITDLIKNGTINIDTAALLWLGIQHELSILIAGGTGSGKTSFLNALANFFPPNQRIISIEDTRELTLPSILHWVPMQTRLPNPEGKGEVTMLDLVVNALRQRPDRILVGEIRRKREAEVLFEAMHTGHSVYATLHANNVEETYDRLTNPPIDIPPKVLSALGLIVVQNRNRRTGKRRTFQVAEVTETGEPRVIIQYDIRRDTQKPIAKPKRLIEILELYTGMDEKRMEKDLAEKKRMLAWLVQNDITDVHAIGRILAKYYAQKNPLLQKALQGKRG